MSEHIEQGRCRVSVIGTGYLGATHAVCLAELGCDVVGVDVEAAKIARLSAGEVPFFEPGLEPLLRKQLERGRLRFTTEMDEAARDADVHFLCVGTPQVAGSRAADLRYVHAAVSALAPRLSRPALVVGKSTVPAGTARSVAEMLRRQTPAGVPVDLAWNPEFLREGFAVQDSLHPDRIVAGVDSSHALETLRLVYAPLLDRGTPMLVMDPASAELVKMAANAFLATKISFINAMAEVCEATGADVNHLAEALALDDRIGGRFLKPGLGFGGGCLPKDIRAFVARAEDLGAGDAVHFLRQMDAINDRRRGRIVTLTAEQLGGCIAGARIAILGCAFKPDSDDVRDSPALDVAGRLAAAGALVRVHDPVAMANAAQSYPQLCYVDSVLQAAVGANAVLHLTEWTQYQALDPNRLAEVVAERHLIDGRNCLDAELWRSAGWTYRAPGRP